jgi:hypothetical protein
MTDIPTVQLTFNPNAVPVAAQLSAAESNEAVSFFLKSLETTDLSASPAPPQNSIVYSLSTSYTADQRRDVLTAWIVAKGLHELVRGLRQTLEEAYLFTEAIKQLAGSIAPIELETRVNEIRQRANKLNFPQLISEVKGRLTSVISFETEILSLIRVRNCLEHRHGVVGSVDADVSGQLSLTLPRLQLVTTLDGKEVEVAPGLVTGESPAAVSIKRVNRERIYHVGEKIEIDAAQFQELAFACHLFAEDIASKLPTV